ncbi:MAG TPA: tetratricopeptide repeat protein [Aliidongia sp.]|nr:tetratricopeptide repeat protein [Aliidongia sp.]
MAAIDTLYARAIEHHLAGRLREAGALYQQILALDPNHAPSLHLLGAIAFTLGQMIPAIELIEAAIAIDGGVSSFHNDLGEAYRVSGRIDEAAHCYVRAIQIEQSNVAALNNLGILLHGAQRYDEAVELYTRALAVEPDHVPARMNLGAALIELGRADEAAAALERAQRLAPDDAKVTLNLANARQAQNRFDDAIALYRALLTAQPDHAEALVNLGRALTESGRPQESLTHYAAALATAPDLAIARFNDGVSRLVLGDLAQGWEGFAWRWRADAVPPHGLSGPLWDGSSLEGKSLLVHAEQGLGDTIQFARFLKQLSAYGAGTVTLLCQPPLKSLMRQVEGADAVVGPDENLPAFDARIPLLDLPRLFGTRIETIDGAPYLSIDAERADAWRGRLARPSVGLVWHGRRSHRNDRNRSMTAATLAPLLGNERARFVSLQKDAAPGELDILRAAGTITDLGEEFADIEQLAEAVAALDLVITVDTAIAHLAGALGRPVWIMLPFAPDWRWMMARPDSPWYASARLFRQRRAGDWAGVVTKVAAALNAWSAGAC